MPWNLSMNASESEYWKKTNARREWHGDIMDAAGSLM